jgi:hypothetical protein
MTRDAVQPALTGTRNGLPESGYRYHGADDPARDAEVAATIAAARAKLAPARCDGCGYLVTAPGHLIACGNTP